MGLKSSLLSVKVNDYNNNIGSSLKNKSLIAEFSTVFSNDHQGLMTAIEAKLNVKTDIHPIYC